MYQTDFRTRRSRYGTRRRRKRESGNARGNVSLLRLRKSGKELKVQRRSETVAMSAAEVEARNEKGIRGIASGIIGNVIGIEEIVIIGIEGE